MEYLLFKEKEEMIISTTTKSPANQSTPWKLYPNPLFILYPQQPQQPPPTFKYHHRLCRPSCIRGLAAAMTTTTRSSKTELGNARAVIVDLKAELESERNMRKETESLMKMMAETLEEERRSRAASERLSNELANSVLNQTAQLERIERNMEEERRMMRVADVLREERFQMKMEDVKIFYEERVRQSVGDRKTGEGRRRWVSEPENPHIKRGIKGFVEFPRGTRTMASNKSNRNLGGIYQLRCQQAQLRIMLKQSNIQPKSVV